MTCFIVLNESVLVFKHAMYCFKVPLIQCFIPCLMLNFNLELQLMQQCMHRLCMHCVHCVSKLVCA